MPKKSFLLFFLLGLTGSLLFFPDRFFSKERLNSTITVSRAEEKVKTFYTLLDKIREGQELLKRSGPLGFTKKTKVVGQKTVELKELARQEVVLAILDTSNGSVIEKRYWLDADEIKKADKIRRNYTENEGNLPRFVFLGPGEEFVVTVNWWNHFNSDLSVAKLSALAELESEKGRFLVVANKFLIKNSNLAYVEDQTGQEYSDIVYTPYSLAIHSPELVTQGKSFLENQVEMAFVRLFERQVPSRAFPGRLATDTVSRQFVKNLFLVEQTDPKMMFLSQDGGLRLAERVFVRLEANQEKTFRYTFSKTGALGLGQIMPKTYSYPRMQTGIVEKYPTAYLIKDVNIGRVDIQNGIMASILTLDDHLAATFRKMSKAQRAKFEAKLKTNPDFINEVLAAIYNGGPGKYLPATASISSKNNETVGFLKKYRMISDLQLFTP